MTHPLGPIIKTQLTQDENGEPVIAWQEVNMTYHKDGNLGIGTPSGVKWDASAPIVMGEPVERMRVSMTDGVGITQKQEPVAFSFTNQPTEWARVDKDGNVTHLDMELCAEGPHNAYTALAIAIWNKAIEEAAKYAAGDGDDLADSIRKLKK